MVTGSYSNLTDASALPDNAEDTLAEAVANVSGTPLLLGHSVILTGAAGGIGAVTARLLAAAGAELTLVDIAEARLYNVADELRTLGAEPVVEVVDASDVEAFQSLTDRATQRLGAVDGLVNCAGLWEPLGLDQITTADWDRTFKVTLQTAFAGCQAVLPGMLARHNGSIVNFASTAGEYGSVRPAAHYAAAKAGVIGLTKSVAREAGPFGVRVNAISPGPIATEALGAMTREDERRIGARTLFGRVGRPDEIAGPCVFLLSKLSTFITGHVLRVNGGALL